jgi:DNA polymerase
MRAVLQAISDELLRLKAEGETTVPVTEETLRGLRSLVKARATATRPAEDLVVQTQASSASPAESGAAFRSARTPPGEAAAIAVKSLAPPALAAALPPPPVVALPDGDKAARWAALRAAVAADPVCTQLLKKERVPVLGSGALDARVMFIGDALGSAAGLDGDPFLDPVGDVLGKMIRAMGLKTAEVYVCNLVPWRPPGADEDKRVVSQAELDYAMAFARAAVDIVNPGLIVGLGLTAAQALLAEKVTKLPDVRSTWRELAGRSLMITYHPSYVLQSKSNRSKRAVWEDLLQVMERAELPISDKQRGYFL